MSAGAADEAATAVGTQRLDKWLWFARFVKTRTLAADIVAAGKVRRQSCSRRQAGTDGARRRRS